MEFKDIQHLREEFEKWQYAKLPLDHFLDLLGAYSVIIKHMNKDGIEIDTVERIKGEYCDYSYFFFWEDFDTVETFYSLKDKRIRL